MSIFIYPVEGSRNANEAVFPDLFKKEMKLECRQMYIEYNINYTCTVLIKVNPTLIKDISSFSWLYIILRSSNVTI